MGYYTEQGTNINNKLNEGYTILNDEVKKHIDDIKDELVKTNDERAEEHITNCEEFSNKITDEFLEKIKEESENVTQNANKWEGWYTDMKSIMGNNGYEGAKSKGFPAWEETEEIEEKVVTIPGPKAGSMDYNTYGTVKKTITTYYWTAYLGIFIDNNGYISFWISNYKQKDGQTTLMNTSPATITSEADYNTYYTNRGSIGGKG